jgi:hypothetical protein
MQSNVDLVKQVFTSIEKGEFSSAEKMFADDFRFKGPSLVALDKRQYLEAHEALVAAMPDWKFNPSDWREEGDQVLVNVHITGSHTRPLHYPFPFMKDEAPTNRRITLPEEPTRVLVRSGKIAAIEADTVSGGGIMGVLAQLGIREAVSAGV